MDYSSWFGLIFLIKAWTIVQGSLVPRPPHSFCRLQYEKSLGMRLSFFEFFEEIINYSLIEKIMAYSPCF